IFKTDDPDIIFKVRNVLRLSHGDRILIADGYGKEYIAELDLLKRDIIGGVIKEEIESESKLSGPSITLAQALTQSKKLDLILRMNTEIGVEEFIFFESDHSKVKLKHIKESKLDRWEKVTREASRQSERLYAPTLKDATEFSALFEDTDATHILFLDSKQHDETKPLSSIVKDFTEKDRILVIIGPEGGFSERETTIALQSQGKFIHLPLPIMRTETAGLVVSSFIKLYK
ncbi:16S rRNA (uracil(1498)-N(3))-methyltransferase, partial [Candidatus Dojkabacteria bacterium]|nr:16S rRNA (uracil(1498)-N(3))-methyltransferase [Candidatus Dojkabacteria bacterium]